MGTILGITGEQSEYARYLRERHKINLATLDISSEVLSCSICHIRTIPVSKADLIRIHQKNTKYLEKIEKECDDNETYMLCKQCLQYEREPDSQIVLTGWPTRIQGGAVYCNKCIKDDLPKPSLLPKRIDGLWYWYCLNCKYTEKMDPGYQKRVYDKQNTFVVSKDSNRQSKTGLDKNEVEDLNKLLGSVAPGAYKVDQSDSSQGY